MKRKTICIVLGLVMLFASGCSNSQTQNTKSSTIGSYDTVQSKPSDSYNEGKSSSDSKIALEGTTNEVENKESQKKIIQTGDIQIIVEDLRKTSIEIKAKVNELGGYVQSEGQSELNSNSIIRVPSDKMQNFTEFMEQKYDVQRKNFSMQDVTDAYVDNDARIRNFKAQEAQILEIMKKANTIEEILKVQNELSKVRGEIESLESRKKVWDKQIDFSTITVNAHKKQTAIESKLKILTAGEFGKLISNGFKGSTTKLVLSFQNIIIFTISNIIIIGGVFIISLILFKKYKKIKRNKE